MNLSDKYTDWKSTIERKGTYEVAYEGRTWKVILIDIQSGGFLVFDRPDTSEIITGYAQEFDSITRIG